MDLHDRGAHSVFGQSPHVVSYENAELTGTYVTLVTNRVDWSAQKIIATYLLRWPIETFYQDGKEQLRLDEYRMREAKAIGKHWCLVFTAYSLLHLDCLPLSLEKGQLPDQNHRGSLPTVRSSPYSEVD